MHTISTPRIAVFCIFLAPLLSADQVVLKNGDTITGSIVKKDGAKLTVKSEFLGEVSMPWSAVKSLKSDADLIVVLPSGEAMSGKISTSGDNLEVTSGTATKSAPLAGVTAVRDAAEQHAFERLEHPRLKDLWAGSYDLGFALARGNAHTDLLTNSFNAARVTRKDKLTVSFTELYSTARLKDVSSTIANSLRGGWTYDRNVSPRLFVTTFNTYEHDPFQTLDLRFVLGGGFGANAVKTDRTTLSFSGGGDYQRENFTNLKRNSAELNVSEDLTYKFSGATNLTQSFRFFPNLTFTGEYRANFDLAAVTTLRKWLGWHVTASDRLVSNPVFGRQRNDLILSTGFRVTFAK